MIILPFSIKEGAIRSYEKNDQGHGTSNIYILNVSTIFSIKVSKFSSPYEIADDLMEARSRDSSVILHIWLAEK